ncbi:hypothetical protein K5X82_07280 [Halosquirtibacter xylanolyticus]|uniref:hypothetical protein n=1 Tax=Halosquirtibacter xylanolyticus TaxID=3374599 RepID=UPI003747E950|nr:hypothetical protein K5X82_07280 [Prolixibacteraceae bacterium]
MTNPVQISLGRKHHKVLRNEFLPKMSRQTIFNALNYRSNTKNSREVRCRAKELLLNEISLIERTERLL